MFRECSSPDYDSSLNHTTSVETTFRMLCSTLKNLTRRYVFTHLTMISFSKYRFADRKLLNRELLFSRDRWPSRSEQRYCEFTSQKVFSLSSYTWGLNVALSPWGLNVDISLGFHRYCGDSSRLSIQSPEKEAEAPNCYCFSMLVNGLVVVGCLPSPRSGQNYATMLISRNQFFWKFLCWSFTTLI